MLRGGSDGVASWLAGTHQGSVEESHLQAYLDEHTFRFNRRRSRARGMLFYRLLQQSLGADPITFSQLGANPNPHPKAPEKKPIPPKERRTAPLSLSLKLPPRPWR